VLAHLPLIILMILAEIISVLKERFNLFRAVFHVNASVRGDVPRQGERMMILLSLQSLKSARRYRRHAQGRRWCGTWRSPSGGAAMDILLNWNNTY
jgi:hypothetical protein